MQTTEINLGWSGYNDPAEEHGFNLAVVKMVQLQGYDCSLAGNGLSLDIICEMQLSGTVRRLAEQYRRVALEAE
ncbi:MAG: hypothetical protein V2I97_24090 [Desulfococcaceae bacterium]|jgi:hypothetical protein|nr:hypothetical protein [Desulfococcaceae bacterium]